MSPRQDLVAQLRSATEGGPHAAPGAAHRAWPGPTVVALLVIGIVALVTALVG